MAPITSVTHVAESKEGHGILHHSISSAKDVDHMINPHASNSHTKRPNQSPRNTLTPLQPLQPSSNPRVRSPGTETLGRLSPSLEGLSPLHSLHLGSDSLSSPSPPKASHLSAVTSPTDPDLSATSFSPSVPSSSGAGSESKTAHVPHTPDRSGLRNKSRNISNTLRSARTGGGEDEKAFEPTPPKDMRVDISRPRVVEEGSGSKKMSPWAGSILRIAQKSNSFGSMASAPTHISQDNVPCTPPGSSEDQCATTQVDSTVEVVSDVSGDDEYSNSANENNAASAIPPIDSGHSVVGLKYVPKFDSWKDEVDMSEYNYDIRELEGKPGKRRSHGQTSSHPHSHAMSRQSMSDHLHSPTHRDGSHPADGDASHFLPSI